ncbi:hypothetical protein [Aliivibrio kagoshimensis]|uniref:hypothetical protein n=1 Tax=Aliivibrio kagoshimensis TaxID=2910230 RepID=UPI003D0EA7D1
MQINRVWPIALILVNHADDLFATIHQSLEAPNTLLEGLTACLGSTIITNRLRSCIYLNGHFFLI